MSKIILIGDTHLGIKKAHPVLMKRQLECWDFLMGYAVEHNIEHLFHLGDFFDDRNSLPIPVINAAHEIEDMLVKNKLKMTLLVGNHDVHFKNRNDVNSPLAVMSCDNIFIYDTPTTLAVEGINIDLIPWINHSNYKESVDWARDSPSKVCLGHFEFSGFPFHKGGRESDSGMSIKSFEGYEKVFSGHYHTKSKRANVEYVGSSFEYTWADWNDCKTFTVLDTDTLETKYVSFGNAGVNFVWIRINEEGNVIEAVPKVPLKDRFVRVTVDGKPNKKTEAVLTSIEEIALSVEAFYADEIVVDKNIVLEETSLDDVLEEVVAASVSNEDIKVKVLTYLDTLKREVQ